MCMKKIVAILLSLLFISGAFAQEKIQDEVKTVVSEGKTIFKLEMANRLGQKIFKAKYKGKKSIEGFVSYTEADHVKLVFYSGGKESKVLGSVLFDGSFDSDKSVVDIIEREINVQEAQLIKLRKNALTIISNVSLFSLPEHATFSVIPVVENNSNKVYVISVSTKEGVVMFGNDYLLSFDEKYNLTEKNSFHKNQASVTFDKNAGTANDNGSNHMHLAEKGEMVSSTDIATLMLYEKDTKWSQHTFISEHYMFFWNYATHDLQVIPKAAPKTK